MYIIVDMCKMAVVYRSENPELLRDLINIEFCHTHSWIMEEQNVAAFCLLELADLKKMLKLISEDKLSGAGNTKLQLAVSISQLCQTLPVTKLNGFQVSLQSLKIKKTDKNHYKYADGKGEATLLEEPFEHAPLVGNIDAALSLPTNPPPAQPVAPIQAKPWAVQPNAAPPKYAPPWL